MTKNILTNEEYNKYTKNVAEQKLKRVQQKT